MIDIHCHLLPGIDDGPPTIEAALALAKACVDDGIGHVVCTPHVFPGRFECRRSSIRDDFDRFSALLAATGLPLSLSWAGEVRLTPEVLDLLAHDELPWLGDDFGGQRTLLLEMPDGQIPLGSERFVAHLRQQRIRPVIAHPERNRAVMENPDRLQPLLDLGCMLQLTAGSLVGGFGGKAQECAAALLSRGWVHAVASDAHNLTGRRPRMSEAAQWLAQHHGRDAVRQLMVAGPAALCGLPPDAATACAQQPAQALHAE